MGSALNCYRCDTPVPDSSRFCQACGADVSGGAAGSAVAIERDPELEEKLAAELEGEFVLERLLGRGGMGAVFLARDLHLQREVAIKVLPPELTYGPGMVERFKREARTAATLDHPNIVPIYRISSTGKIVWFVMKYVEGETLAETLDRVKVLPASRVVAIVGKVADALEFAHRRGVIHRDVKPANVMLDRDGKVTVTDFGIAKAAGLEPLTGSGAMIGTPFYMSPEQCAGKAQITGASDQYSLGVMAYQMLSGRLPFVGESTIDVIKQQCFDTPPPLRELRPSLPPQLVAAVERALVKEPERRFPSVMAFARACDPTQRTEPDTVRLDGAVDRTARVHRRWRVAGSLVAIAAIAVIGLAMWRQNRAGPSPGISPSSHESTSVAPQQPPVDPTGGQSAAIVRIAPEAISIKVGERYALLATAFDTALNVLPTARVTWTSSNTNIAKVADDGTVTGVTSGVTTVEARVGQHRSQTAVKVSAAVLPLVPRSSTGSTHPGLNIGWVRLGSRYDRKQWLYVDDTLILPIGALSYWQVHAGSVRLSIRAAPEERCVAWDSVLIIVPGDTVNIGRKLPACPQ